MVWFISCHGLESPIKGEHWWKTILKEGVGGHILGIFAKKLIQNSVLYGKYETSELEKFIFLYSLVVLVPPRWKQFDLTC